MQADSTSALVEIGKSYAGNDELTKLQYHHTNKVTVTDGQNSESNKPEFSTYLSKPKKPDQ